MFGIGATKRIVQRLGVVCVMAFVLTACSGTPAESGRAGASGDRSVPLEALFAVLEDEGRQVLGTSEGYALYIFDGDGLNESKCLDACALTFIPFEPPPAGEERVAGEGVETDLVGRFDREDGIAQVTYGGRALYRFSADVEPGDSAGEGSAGRWFHVSPLGVRVPRAG